jgi:hypothetical protein
MAAPFRRLHLLLLLLLVVVAGRLAAAQQHLGMFTVEYQPELAQLPVIDQVRSDRSLRRGSRQCCCCCAGSRSPGL